MLDLSAGHCGSCSSFSNACEKLDLSLQLPSTFRLPVKPVVHDVHMHDILRATELPIPFMLAPLAISQVYPL
jgi:hypothetical protein